MLYGGTRIEAMERTVLEAVVFVFVFFWSSKFMEDLKNMRSNCELETERNWWLSM